MRCLALIARRQPDALTRDGLAKLLGAAVETAMLDGCYIEPESDRDEYFDDCGKATLRIMWVIIAQIKAERRPRS